jgi:hypothetical protein
MKQHSQGNLLHSLHGFAAEVCSHLAHKVKSPATGVNPLTRDPSAKFEVVYHPINRCPSRVELGKLPSVPPGTTVCGETDEPPFG